MRRTASGNEWLRRHVLQVGDQLLGAIAMNSMPGLSQGEAMILQSLLTLERHVAAMAEQLEDLRANPTDCGPKDWYTTAELAAMMGVTGHTVRERWCNQGRIECSKDPATGKWRIPGREFERLRKGGRPEGL